MRKGGTEVSTIQTGLLRRARNVQLLTARTVYADRGAPLQVRETQREAELVLAWHSRAVAEARVLVLVEHAGHAPSCQDVPCMN